MTYLSHREYRLLTRAEGEAKANLGMHTGGPHEAEYRVFLEDLRKVVIKIKHGGNEKPVKAKRREGKPVKRRVPRDFVGFRGTMTED